MTSFAQSTYGLADAADVWADGDGVYCNGGGWTKFKDDLTRKLKALRVPELDSARTVQSSYHVAAQCRRMREPPPGWSPRQDLPEHGGATR